MLLSFFFFNDTATTEIYTLSLHDALPIFKRFMALLMAMLMITPVGAFAANHRSAPISALDHPAGITDWYAFVSYDDPTKVTLILDVDPMLEPSNGPTYFPFDPGVVYTMKIDNDYDGLEDLTFEF